MRRDDDEEDVRGHDRPEDGTHLEIGGARGEELAGDPGDCDDEQGGRDRDAEVVAQQPAGKLVDEQAADQEQRRSADGFPRGQVGDRGVDQPRIGVGPVEEDEQREAAEPRRVGLPLEPVQRLGQDARRDAVLLRVVEAAAVDTPVLARDALVEIRALGRRREPEIQPDEVERGADPGDPGDHVEEAKDEVGDLPQVVRFQPCCSHLALAIAQSSRTPVSSSSSRVRASRPRSTSRISAFGRRSTKTTKRKPNFSS